MLGETRVASPKFQGDTIGWVRAGVKTEVAAMVLNQAIGEEVESLVLNRWVARLQGYRRTIFDFTISDRAEIH